MKRNTMKTRGGLGVCMLSLALILSACGGGGGSTPTGGGGGSTPTVLGSVILATQNSTGATQLSAFPYGTNGTIASGTPTATYTIPTGSACSGSAPFDAGYDHTNHLLFVYVNPTTSTTSVCSFAVNPLTGALTAAGSLTNVTGTHAEVDRTDDYVMVDQSGTPNFYAYTSAGVISTSATPLGVTVPSGDSIMDGDLLHRFVWYGPTGGTSVSGGDVFNPGFTQKSPISTTVSNYPVNSSFNDEQNGIVFGGGYPSSGCSTTPTTLSLLSYTTTTGIFTTTSNSGVSIGACTQVIGQHNKVDSVYDMLFVSGGSGSITPYQFSVSTLVLTPLPSVTATGDFSGTERVDYTNHILFAATAASGSNSVAGLSAYAYSTSGLVAQPSSVPLQLGTYTVAPTCSSGVQCAPLIFSVVY